MKTINIIFITALLVSPVVAKHPTIHPTHNGVVRKDLGALSPADKGFIKYIGDFGGYEVIALSSDKGSALPSEDLRIYLKKGRTRGWNQLLRHFRRIQTVRFGYTPLRMEWKT